MKKIAIAALAGLGGLLIAMPAAAAPVFLKCNILSNGKVWPVNFVVDEEAARAAVIVAATGYVTQGPAVFTPDKVMVRQKDIEYEISRTDLTVTRKVSIPKSRDSGPCKVEEPPKRAF